MATIYLASAYERRDEMRDVRNICNRAGHMVCSSWLDEDFSPEAAIHTYPLKELQWMALRDEQEICKAELLILYPGSTRGGSHVEFGIARGQGKRTIVVGEPTNIFHYLTNVEVYPTLEEALKHVQLA